MTTSQKNWVKQQLRENGEVSRNTALKNFVSRLSAIICVLRKEGYEFTTFSREGDYVYRHDNPSLKRQYIQLHDESGNLIGVKETLV